MNLFIICIYMYCLLYIISVSLSLIYQFLMNKSAIWLSSTNFFKNNFYSNYIILWYISDCCPKVKFDTELYDTYFSDIIKVMCYQTRWKCSSSEAVAAEMSVKETRDRSPTMQARDHRCLIKLKENKLTSAFFLSGISCKQDFFYLALDKNSHKSCCSHSHVFTLASLMSLASTNWGPGLIIWEREYSLNFQISFTFIKKQDFG